MGHTIVLALAAAVYPTILAAVIVILGQPKARQLLIGFLVGGMAMSIGSGFAVLVAIEQSDKVIALHKTTRPDISIAVGALSLVVAWVIWTDRAGRLGARRRASRPRPDKPSLTERVLGRGSLWPAISAGALLSLPGFWYLAALTGIADAQSTGSQVAQVLVFNAIMFLLVEIPLAMFLIDEQHARRRVAAFSAWLHAHAREVGAALATVVGVYLIARGALEAGLLG